jgi:copper(I)-binding protein
MIIKSWLRPLAMGALLCCAAEMAAAAHEYKLGELEIAHPWTRATIKGQPTAGAFLTVTNHGSQPDRLVSVSSPIARTAELHSMSIEGGVMKMRALTGGIDIPAGGTVELAPGSLHVMLIGPEQALAEGTRVPLTLTFQHSGTLEVELAVEKPGAKPAAPVHEHDHGS